LDYVFKYHSISRKSTTTIYKNLFTEPKPEGQLRGVVLGGSTAEGFPYASNHSFSGILAKALEYSLNRPVQVLNLGFSAMSSYYVRDAASKIADLDLDFVIIYSGHNEYYGTISYSTGSSHFSNLLNMRLKDSRLFQTFFNLLASGNNTGASQQGETLMARQFAEANFPPAAEQEQVVGQILSDNITKAATIFSQKGIPVYVLEPVSNLVDMAPFVSRRQAGLSDQWQEIGERLMGGDAAAAQAVLQGVEELQGQGSVQEFLIAQAKLLLKEEDYAQFILAKDLDLVPFRARQGVVAQLRQALQGLEGVHWVPTSQGILERFGLRGFSNLLFIDHLHFNHRGQQVVAEIISQAMLQTEFLNAQRQDALRDFFTSPELMDEATFFLGIYDYTAKDKVSSLINAPPYTQMTFPYQNTGAANGLQVTQLEAFLRGTDLKTVQNEDLIDRYASFLLANNDQEAYLQFLQAFNQVNPGSENTYYMSGNFFAQFRWQGTDRGAKLQ
jgi:hypothetical protein